MKPARPRAPDLATLRLMSPDRVLTALRYGRHGRQGEGLSAGRLGRPGRSVAGAAPVRVAALPNGACRSFIRTACQRARRSALERLGRGPLAASVPARRNGAAHREPGAVVESEMGVRISRRHPCVWTADDRRRPIVRRQRGAEGLFARRKERMPILDIRRSSTGASRDHDRVDGDQWTAYVGDQAAMDALNALTGTARWQTKIEPTNGVITGAPTLANGTLYMPVVAEEGSAVNPRYECCKFRGSVTALDARTGTVRWKTYTIADAPAPTTKSSQGVQLWGPSGAAVWSSPTVDLQASVYVTTGDGYSDPVARTTDAFIALDMETGRMLWSRQLTENDSYTMGCGLPSPLNANCPAASGPDFDFGSSPILVEGPNNRRTLIAGQKSSVVHALNADNGEVLWQTKLGQGGRVGGVQWGSAFDGSRVYVALSDAAMGTPAPGVRGAQPTMLGVPLVFDPKAGGGLFALNPQTGAILWKTPHPGCGDAPGCSPAQSAAVTALPGVVFSGGLDGHLRAYAANDGKIIWDVDTTHEYETVNGVKASGGALDGPGAVVVDGMLYVNSGYANFGSTRQRPARLFGRRKVAARFSRTEGLEILFGRLGPRRSRQCSGNFRFRGTASLA